MNKQVENIKLSAPSSLLIYLAYRGKWIPRTELAFLYKPDEPEVDAKRYLRLLIHRAKSIPWATNLEVERTQLRFLIGTDVAEYLKAYKDKNWQKACSLYKGKFLNGLSLAEVYSFNSWLELERTELEYKHQNALRRRAEELIKQGNEKEASESLLELLDYDWTNEEVVRLAIQAACASGQNALANNVYARFEKVLKDELDLEPLAETKELLEELSNLNGLEPTQKKAASFTKVSLPAQSTRFIGRKNDLKRLNQSCSSEGCRLLSIVGLGGIGKTRLGLELARSQVSNFADGVFFIALADIKAKMLANTISRALEIPTDDDSKTKKLLLDFLIDKRLLLVLDNFEHILDCKGLLAEMLELSPGIKIVVTTRVSLKLKAEHIYELRGLDYPKDENQDKIQDFDAVKLFLSAAKRVAPGLKADDESLKLITKICQLVEGMPLAIELSSSWLRIISLEQLYKEIQKSLDMFSSEHSDIALRHRNVRAVFDYSWQRLSEKQQDILKRLSVFRGGFNLKAAEKVARAHLGHLLNMTNESFIRSESNNRFSMHELIRKYVSDELKKDSDLFDLYGLEHARYFATMLADCDIEDYEKSKKALLNIDADIENIRLAWVVLVGNCLLKELIGSIRALDYFYGNRGLFQEAKEFYLSHVSSLEKHCANNSLDYAKIISSLKFRAAISVSRQDQSSESSELFAQALEIADRFEIEEISQRCYFELGVISYKQGNYSEAEGLFLKAKRIGEDLNDDRIVVDAVNALGLVAKATNNIEQAREYLHQSIRMFNKLNYKRGEAMAFSNLGNLEEALGNYKQAQKLYYKGLPIFEEMNFIPGIAVIKSNIGVIEYRLNNLPKALKMSLEALELKRKMHGQRGIVKSYLNLSRIHMALKERQEAIRYLYQALDLAEQNYFEPSLIEVVSHFVESVFIESDKIFAAQICHAILNHPKAEGVYKDQAKITLDELSPEKDYQELSLEQVVANLWNLEQKLKR